VHARSTEAHRPAGGTGGLGRPGASYLELVELLQSRDVDTHGDCVELFRRVVFNILIHNTEDHLRNHGFFISQDGISLAPAVSLRIPKAEREFMAGAFE
jgi:serine/threonine-protein kinase HipA